MKDIYITLKKDFTIKKMCAYGFLKELRFFEPYLLIYLLGMGLSFFQIGILFAISKGLTYLFEVPSGIIADLVGMKKELMLCFVFYIIAFFLFFIGGHFYVFGFGMAFYGLGEAFRTGTHKAMILKYLEHENWYEHKAFVYARTRSFSLLGASLSAFLSILFILNIPADQWIFIISILPYLLDFLLIATYPKYMDQTKTTTVSFKSFIQSSQLQLQKIFTTPRLLQMITHTAFYDSLAGALKDYIQPIMKILIIASFTYAIFGYTGDDLVKIYLGCIYGVMNLITAFGVKHVYKLALRFNKVHLLNYSYGFTGMLYLLMSLFLHQNWLIALIILYITTFLIADLRRPLFIDLSSDIMASDTRATVLSIESQLGSLMSIIIAPLLGLIADLTSITVVFTTLGILVICSSFFLKIRKV